MDGLSRRLDYGVEVEDREGNIMLPKLQKKLRETIGDGKISSLVWVRGLANGFNIPAGAEEGLLVRVFNLKQSLDETLEAMKSIPSKMGRSLCSRQPHDWSFTNQDHEPQEKSITNCFGRSIEHESTLARETTNIAVGVMSHKMNVPTNLISLVKDIEYCLMPRVTLGNLDL